MEHVFDLCKININTAEHFCNHFESVLLLAPIHCNLVIALSQFILHFILRPNLYLDFRDNHLLTHQPNILSKHKSANFNIKKYLGPFMLNIEKAF